jgi:crossover junction endodeoxyribonuclease RusA
MTIITLPYPVSTNRMWRHRGTVTYLSAEGKSWKRDANLSAKQHGAVKIDGDVCVLLVLHPRANKNGSASKSVLDLGNAEKCTIDAMQGALFDDDKQVKMMLMRYGKPKEGGGVTLLVAPMDEQLILVNYLIHGEL